MEAVCAGDSEVLSLFLLALSIEVSFPTSSLDVGSEGRQNIHTLRNLTSTLGLTVRPAPGKSVSTGHSSQEMIQAPWLFLFEHSSVEPYAMLGGSSSQSGRVSLGERETYPREVAVMSPERLS